MKYIVPLGILTYYMGMYVWNNIRWKKKDAIFMNIHYNYVCVYIEKHYSLECCKNKLFSL